MKVAIAAYGAGNVRSVELALARLGAESALVHDAGPLLDADLAVLPGVGSAATAMTGLRERGLDRALRLRASLGRPILGICLGLQLALDESEEDGGVRGLGLVPGRAVRLREGRVPRIGWAVVEPLAGSAGGEADAGRKTGSPSATVARRSGSRTRTPPRARRRPRRARGSQPWSNSGRSSASSSTPEKSGAPGQRFLAAYLERCLSRA